MSDGLVILVSDDRLAARLAWPASCASAGQWPSEAALVAACEQRRIPITAATRARLGAIASGAATPDGDAARLGGPAECLAFTLATAVAPIEAQDGRFEWAPELRPPPRLDSEGRIDPFSVDAIVTVAEGTTIGRLVPPQDGVAGADVFGQPLAPRRTKGQPIQLGAGVRGVEDAGGVSVVATRAGRVAEERLKLSVNEQLDVSGDVDFASGSIQSLVDVVVRGTVRAKFHVHTQGSLSVGKAVEAADIQAGGDVVVHGGVFGANRTGRTQAGGTVRATLFNEVVVVSGGTIAFEREILNCDVRTQDRVVSENGTIIGGHTYARNGIAIGVAGSEAGVQTELAIGYDIDVLRETHRLEREAAERRKSAGEIRTLVEPLLKNLKRLTPAQRERATELLSKASEVEDAAEEMELARKMLLSDHAPADNVALLVREAVYPGVHVRIGPRATVIRRLVPGPLRIEVRKVDEISEIVAVSPRSGSVTILPSTEVDLGPAPAHKS